MYPVIAIGYRAPISDPVIRITIGGTPYNCIIPLVAGRTYWIPRDGELGYEDEDMLEIIEVATRRYTPYTDLAWRYNTSGTYVGRCYFWSPTGSPAVVNWTAAETTFDATALGWTGDADATSTGGSIAYAEFKTPHLWFPQRWMHSDSTDVPEMIGAHVVTANGLARGYRITTGYRRETTWRYLPRELVELGIATNPYSTIYNMIESVSDGTPVRIYADSTDLTTRESARKYRWIPGGMPNQTENAAPRYEWNAAWHRDDSGIDPGYALDMTNVGTGHADLNSTSAATIFNSLAECTWSYWYKAPSFPGPRAVLVRNSGHYQFSMSTSSAANLTCYIAKTTADNTTYRTTSAATLVAGQWHHIACVFDGALSGASKLAIYIDGAVASSASYGTWTQTTLTAATSGSAIMRVGDASNASGYIDSICIFPSALDAAEVASMTAGGRTGNPRKIITSTQPRAFWRFDGDLVELTGGYTLADGGVPMRYAR